MKKQIVVIDNGFVHVGDCRIAKGFLTITDAQNIRKWGTTAGLGQLINGPTKSTEADPIGTVIVPMGRVVFFINVVSGW